jgi:transcriptional regulator with XRE-family HTH domain
VISGERKVPPDRLWLSKTPAHREGHMLPKEMWMILRARHHHGWKIAELAREFGMSRTTVSRHLKGDGPPTYPRAAAVLTSASSIPGPERAVSISSFSLASRGSLPLSTRPPYSALFSRQDAWPQITSGNDSSSGRVNEI